MITNNTIKNYCIKILNQLQTKTKKNKNTELHKLYDPFLL